MNGATSILFVKFIKQLHFIYNIIAATKKSKHNFNIRLIFNKNIVQFFDVFMIRKQKRIKNELSIY